MLRKSTRIRHHVAGDAVAHPSLVLLVCLCLFCFAQSVHAAIEWSGDVNPDDPTIWTSNMTACIGKYGYGTGGRVTGEWHAGGAGFLTNQSTEGHFRPDFQEFWDFFWGGLKSLLSLLRLNLCHFESVSCMGRT